MGAPTAGSATLTRADSKLVSRVTASPNFGHRGGRAVDMLVLHYTGMDTGQNALARLCDPASEVSSHYLVWRDGAIDQLVGEAERAWHAGAAFWAGEIDINSVSIGIEIENGGHDYGLPPYPDAQIAAVIDLAQDICDRWQIAPARVLGHSDVAPSRKLDPGERFPWRTLAAAGVGVWVEVDMAAAPKVELPGIADIQQKLKTIGYRCDVTGAMDELTRVALVAMQRHWRPTCVNGVVDAETAATLDALLATNH